jgi:hypothetical protein
MTDEEATTGDSMSRSFFSDDCVTNTDRLCLEASIPPELKGGVTSDELEMRENRGLILLFLLFVYLNLSARRCSPPQLWGALIGSRNMSTAQN